MTLLVELGPLGLAAGVILCGCAVAGGLRRMNRQHRRYCVRADKGSLMAIAIGVLAVHLVFSGLPIGSPGMLLLWCVYLAGVWVLALLATYYLIAQTDEKRASAHWLCAGVMAAIGCTLIHNLIGFSLFTPAGLTYLVVAFATANALRRLGDDGQEPPTEIEHAGAGIHSGVISAGGLAVLAIYIVVIAWPTIRTQVLLRQAQARVHTATSYAQAFAALEQTHQELSNQPWLWDPTIPSWAAETALQIAGGKNLSTNDKNGWFALAEALATQTVDCTPRAFSVQRLRARIRQLWAEQTGDLNRLLQAETSWSKERAAALSD